MHLVRRLNPPFLVSHNGLRSQTSWIWLETKLIELGMLGGSQSYQVIILMSFFHLSKRCPCQISFGKLWDSIGIAQYEDEYPQCWTKPLCSLYFPRGMGNHIVIMLSLYKSSGITSRNCE